jgi:amino acid transporter
MAFTYIRFQKAIKAQGLVREEYLVTRSRFAPWCGYWAFGWAFLFLWVQGYAVFTTGNWSVPTFIFNYGIVSTLTPIAGVAVSP